MIDGGLRGIFRARVPPPVHWTSVETGGTGRGVPDSNFCIDGVEGWIEYKLTAGFAVNLRPEQVGWLVTRARHGGRCFVAVRRQCGEGPRRDKADELYLFAGFVARELRDEGLRPFAVTKNAPTARRQAGLLGCWTRGPSNWDWDEVRQLLVD